MLYMVRTILVVALVGCASPQQVDPARLQMNDVSVLLPLPQTQAEVDEALALTTPGRGGDLVPLDVFKASTVFEETDKFHLTAFRVDPCFAKTDADTVCNAQLRLVFQSLSPGVADDIAVHAFYSLSGDEVLALADELATARREDGVTEDLGPLAIHPVIAREGLAGPLMQAYAGIVAKYAGAENLVRVNTFSAIESDISLGYVSSLTWTFTSFDTAPLAPRPIATLADGPNHMDLTADLAPLVTMPSPTTLSQDAILPLADSTMAQASPAAAGTALAAALRIENPHFHSPDTIDCVSCHMAQPAIELVGKEMNLSMDGAFSAPDVIPGDDLAHTTQLIGSDRGLNIHAFSYRGAEPMINQRTINETAEVVAYIASKR